MKLVEELAFGAGGQCTAAKQSFTTEPRAPTPAGPIINTSSLHEVFTEARADLIRFLSRRTANPALAADLTHDLYEKLAHVQAHFPTGDHARAYLYRMAANLATDHVRVERRRRELLCVPQDESEQCEPSAEFIVMQREQLLHVQRALDELPINVRQVLLLLRIEGLRHKDVAQRLGISVSLVEKHQVRALAHCRARLNAYTHAA